MTAVTVTTKAPTSDSLFIAITSKGRIKLPLDMPKDLFLKCVGATKQEDNSEMMELSLNLAEQLTSGKDRKIVQSLGTAELIDLSTKYVEAAMTFVTDAIGEGDSGK